MDNSNWTELDTHSAIRMLICFGGYQKSRQQYVTTRDHLLMDWPNPSICWMCVIAAV